MLKRIQTALPNLSSAERRVADWLLQDPQQVLTRSLAQIARSAGVSEPTVIRFCRSLGCSGFRDFKLVMAQTLAKSDALLHTDVTAGDTTKDILFKVIGKSVQEMNSLLSRLDAVVLDEAAVALLKAERISFFGMGASGIVAEDAHNKFFRLGISCHCYRDRPTLLQAAAIAGQNDAVIAISKIGSQSAVVQATQLARENGATTIGLTSPLSPLSENCDFPILIDINEDTGYYTPMSSRLVQLAVLDVLQVTLALKLGQEAIDKQERAKAILRAKSCR